MKSLAQAYARQLSRYTRRERLLAKAIMRHAPQAKTRDAGKLAMLYNTLRVK